MSRPATLVGVCGGTASGKTSLALKVQDQLGVQCVVLAMDSFYRGLSPEEHDHAAEYNFDHPSAIDFAAIEEALHKLMRKEPAEIPIYDFVTHTRNTETQLLQPADLIIFEGIHSLYDEPIRSLMSLKIFVQTDDDIRLARRLLRDTSERGRDVPGVIHQYTRFVKPSYDEFIKPTSKHADVIIPHGSQNKVAIDLVVKTLKASLGLIN